MDYRMSDEQAVLNWIAEGNPNGGDVFPEQILEKDFPGLILEKSLSADDGIYGSLAEHQVATQWRHRELAAELHRWAVILNSEFNFSISEIALRIDWLPWLRLGHFRPGHNGFGLKGEIALNERYLHLREPWQLLGTLLHELLHAWQQEHGKPGKPPYHNKQFRRKALEYGLVIDESGVTEYLPESRFKDLLTQHGIHVPQQPEPPRRCPGQSKLKKWSCRCPVNVRVAIADFNARCLNCGGVFVLMD